MATVESGADQAATPLFRDHVLITGGRGTGKTSTARKTLTGHQGVFWLSAKRPEEYGDLAPASRKPLSQHLHEVAETVTWRVEIVDEKGSLDGMRSMVLIADEPLIDWTPVTIADALFVLENGVAHRTRLVLVVQDPATLPEQIRTWFDENGDRAVHISSAETDASTVAADS